MAENKQGTFRTTIGGQALIEGILMRGPEKDAIVVRAPEGLVTKVTERKFIKDKFPILGWPIIRGMATFLSSIVTGVKALMFSADYFPDDENATSTLCSFSAGTCFSSHWSNLLGWAFSSSGK